MLTSKLFTGDWSPFIPCFRHFAMLFLPKPPGSLPFLAFCSFLKHPISLAQSQHPLPPHHVKSSIPQSRNPTSTPVYVVSHRATPQGLMVLGLIQPMGLMISWDSPGGPGQGLLSLTGALGLPCCPLPLRSSVCVWMTL